MIKLRDILNEIEIDTLIRKPRQLKIGQEYVIKDNDTRNKIFKFIGKNGLTYDFQGYPSWSMTYEFLEQKLKKGEIKLHRKENINEIEIDLSVKLVIGKWV